MNAFLKKLFVLGIAAGAALALASTKDSAQKQVLPTCQINESKATNGSFPDALQNTDQIADQITDLCSAVNKPERYLEYFHCSPNLETHQDVVIHYIFQETYSDKENSEGIKLARLFKAQGKSNQSVRELIAIEQIDAQLDSMSPDSNSDLMFASHANNLVFSLQVTSSNGELLKGKITNTATRDITEVTCLDISLEK